MAHKALQRWQRARGTHLLEHAVQGLGAADVKADEHSVRVGVGQGPHVVVVGRACGQEERRAVSRARPSACCWTKGTAWHPLPSLPGTGLGFQSELEALAHDAVRSVED